MPEPEPQPEKKGADPVRRATIVVLIVCAVLIFAVPGAAGPPRNKSYAVTLVLLDPSSNEIAPGIAKKRNGR